MRRETYSFTVTWTDHFCVETLCVLMQDWTHGLSWIRLFCIQIPGAWPRDPLYELWVDVGIQLLQKCANDLTHTM